MAANGASLEDCRTNVFSLTELTGLKWKRFLPATPRAVWNDVEGEPVFAAYGKCLAEGLMCVWRRTPLPPSQTATPTPGGGIVVDLRVDTPKELWVFWYTVDEPANLAACTHMLPVAEEGSWQNPGIAYEIRILLFKALHNLIERCLLQDGYVRFGKWFTRPLESPTAGAEHCSPGFLTALNFSFFVHGDCVCMTVSVQRQPPLYKVAKRHLSVDGGPQTVILAPWSLQATLVAEQPFGGGQLGQQQHYGRGGGTPNVNQLWNEWKHFHPLMHDSDDDIKENMGYVDEFETERQERARAAALPRMLQVEIDGVRMYYPTCYIAVVADEDLSRRQPPSGVANAAQAPSTSTATGGSVKRRASTAETNDSVSEPQRRSVLHARCVNGARVVQLAVEESCLASSSSMYRRRASQSPANELPNMNNDDDQRWNIVDCTKQREKCPCKACSGTAVEAVMPQTAVTAAPPPTPPIMSKGAHKFAPPNSFVKHGKMARSAFHRRSPLTVLSSSLSSPALIDEQQQQPLSTTVSTSSGVSVASAPRHFPPISVQPALGQTSISQLAGPSTASVYQNISPVPPSRTQSPQVDFGGAATSLNERKPSPLVDSMNSDMKFFPPSRSASHMPNTVPVMLRPPLAATNLPPTFRTVASLGDLRDSKLENERPRTRHRIKWPKIDHLDPTFTSIENGEQSAENKHLDQTAEDDAIFFVATTSSKANDENDAQRENASTSACQMREVKDEPMDDSYAMSNGNPTNNDFHSQHNMLTRLLSEDDDAPPPPTASTSGAAARLMPNLHTQSPYYASMSVSSDGMPTIAMPENFMDTTSPSLAHSTDSVHLSPPASLERDDSAQNAHGSSIPSISNPAYALLQRGPASVGGVEYSQIYPTPPSVDAAQPQQFSPPNAALIAAQKNALMANVVAMSVTVPTVESIATAAPFAEPATDEVTLDQVDDAIDQSAIYKWSRLCSYPVSKKYFDDSSPRSSSAIASLLTGRPVLQTPPEYKQSAGFALKQAMATQSTYHGHHHHRHHPHLLPLQMPQQQQHHPGGYFGANQHVQQVLSPGVLAPGGQQQQHHYGMMQMQRPSMRPTPPSAMMYQNSPVQQQMMAPPTMMPHQMGYGSMMHGSPGMPHPQMPPMRQSSVQQLNEFVNNSMFNAGPMPPASMQQQHGMQMQTNPYYGRPPAPMMPGQQPYMMDVSGGSADVVPAPYAPGAQMGGAYSGQVGSPYGSQHHASPQMMRQISQPRTPSNLMMQHGQSPYNRSTSSVQSLSMGGGDAPALRAMIPEGKALVLAVLMRDTVLDLHYDIIFDSCLICACNNADIRSPELGIYLTQNMGHFGGFQGGTGGPNKCVCGFSAVRHRYLSMHSGLFPDDAREATGLPQGIGQPPTQPQISPTVWFDASASIDKSFIDLLRHQSLVRDLGALITSVDALRVQSQRSMKVRRTSYDPCDASEYVISEVDIKEVNAACSAAIDAACAAMPLEINRPMSNTEKRNLLHSWGVQLANEISEAREAECMAVLGEVQPLLDRTMQRIRGGGQQQRGVPRIVDETLTWRTFDRKALKSANTQDEDCQPEPIPTVVVALERDPLSASPHIVRFWERLTLGPFDQPKDVMYLAVVPDNNLIYERSKKFFDELSKLYESCRFGRHVRFGQQPITRISTNARGTNSEEWYDKMVGRHIDNKAFLGRLKAYTKQWEQALVESLTGNDAMFERAAYREAMQRESNASQPSSSGLVEQMPPPALPQATNTSISAAVAASSTTSGINSPQLIDGTSAETPSASTMVDGEQHQPDDDPSALPHVLVVYVVNPFLFGAESHHELLARVVTVGMMRAFNSLLGHLPALRRPYVQLEIVSLQQIFDYTGLIGEQCRDERGVVAPFDAGLAERRLNQRLSACEALKTLAFSVYAQTRVVLHDVVRGVLAKSMTRFGPASSTGDILDDLSRKQQPVAFKVPCQPFVLSSTLPLSLKTTGEIVPPTGEETVLFVSYCLIGCDWLAAAVTDHRGHMLDNCLINLRQEPKGARYRHKTQILDALSRLWLFIQGVLTTGLKNWRLVIGRVGRIGHGEFKAWAQFLSKQNLRKQGQHLKQSCNTCNLMPGFNDTPTLLSACLVSMEPEPRLRVFPNFMAHDDKFSKNPKHRTLRTPDDASCTHILVFPARSDITLDQPGHLGGQDDDIDVMNMDFLNDVNDEFKDIDMGDIGLSSAALPSAGVNKGGNVFFFGSDTTEAAINNQPLATGFYVSTAPAIDLPDWFWSPCPGAKRRLPVQLRSSLHLNTQNVQASDDVTGTTNALAHNHPLESDGSDEVLRYVLETYNALSWLNIDLVTGERRSCLPVHIQALLRLCNSVSKLIA